MSAALRILAACSLIGSALACSSTETAPEPPPKLAEAPEPEPEPPPPPRLNGDPSWPRLRVKSVALCVEAFLGLRRQHADPELFIFVYQEDRLIAASRAPDRASLTASWSERPFVFRFRPGTPLDIRVAELSWKDDEHPERLFELAEDYLKEAPKNEAEARAKIRAAREEAMAGPRPPKDPEAAFPDPPDLGPYVLSQRRVEGGLLPALAYSSVVLAGLETETQSLSSGVRTIDGAFPGRWVLEVQSPDGSPRPPLIAPPEELGRQLTIHVARYPMKTEANLDWDVGFFGSDFPDPYVVATFEESLENGKKAYFQLAVTEEKSNAMLPVWKDDVFAISYPSDRDLVFFLMDRDLSSDDRMARVRVRPNTRGQYEFPAEEGTGSLEIELR